MKRRSVKPERTGTALVPVVIAGAMLMSVSMAFVTIQVANNEMVSTGVDDVRARLLAASAAAEAAVALQAGATGNVGTPATPAYLADGLFWVQSTDLGGDQYRLLVTAAVGSGRAGLEVVVDAGGEDSPLFVSTLNSKEELTLNESVVSDSYLSSLGSYESQAGNFTNGYFHAEMNGDMTSNEGIVVNANANILGDATPGPGYGVSTNTGSYISGSTDAAPELFTFPPIEVPPIPSTGDLIVANGGLDTLPAGNHGFDTIEINKYGVLVVEGPANVVVGDFNGLKDSRLKVDARNGPVSIYCTTSYLHEQGFESVPVDGSPMAVAFFITAEQDIVFPSNANIRGAYYAPESTITFSAGNEAWGAFAGRRVAMSSSMRFHYDEDLSKYWDEDTGQEVEPVLTLSWNEARVTPDLLRTNRTDPFRLLNQDRNALLCPADAWDWGL